MALFPRDGARNSETVGMVSEHSKGGGAGRGVADEHREESISSAWAETSQRLKMGHWT